MNPYLKIAGITLLALIVLVAGWAGAVFWGWASVPPFVTNAVAQAKHLTPSQAQALNRAVNVYQVLKSSPEAPLVDKALALAAQKAHPDQWEAFAQRSWPQVTPQTLEKVRVQLGVTPQDFDVAKAIVDKQMAEAAQTGTFHLNPAQAETLKKLADEYHLSELLGSLK